MSTLIINPFAVASGAAPAFTANTAVFDGTNDYLSDTNGIDGQANQNTATLSCWVNFAGGDGALQHIFGDTTAVPRFRVSRNASNKIAVHGASGGGSEILNIASNTSITSSSGWKHVYVCVDMASKANTKIYIDGVSDGWTETTFSVGTALGMNINAWRVGAGNSAVNKLNATLAELWFRFGYLDNPSAFRDGTKPKDIGSDGSTPASPHVYLSRAGSGNTWATDSAPSSTNVWTVTGALGTGTPP